VARVLDTGAGGAGAPPESYGDSKAHHIPVRPAGASVSAVVPVSVVPVSSMINPTSHSTAGADRAIGHSGSAGPRTPRTSGIFDSPSAIEASIYGSYDGGEDSVLGDSLYHDSILHIPPHVSRWPDARRGGGWVNEATNLGQEQALGAVLVGKDKSPAPLPKGGWGEEEEKEEAQMMMPSVRPAHDASQGEGILLGHVSIRAEVTRARVGEGESLSGGFGWLDRYADDDGCQASDTATSSQQVVQTWRSSSFLSGAATEPGGSLRTGCGQSASRASSSGAGLDASSIDTAASDPLLPPLHLARSEALADLTSDTSTNRSGASVCSNESSLYGIPSIPEEDGEGEREGLDEQCRLEQCRLVPSSVNDSKLGSRLNRSEGATNGREEGWMEGEWGGRGGEGRSKGEEERPRATLEEEERHIIKDFEMGDGAGARGARAQAAKLIFGEADLKGLLREGEPLGSENSAPGYTLYGPASALEFALAADVARAMWSPRPLLSPSLSASSSPLGSRRDAADGGLPPQSACFRLLV